MTDQTSSRFYTALVYKSMQIPLKPLYIFLLIYIIHMGHLFWDWKGRITRNGRGFECLQRQYSSESIAIPFWALCVCSSICLSLSISSAFSLSIRSFSFSASSRFFFSFSSCALSENTKHKHLVSGEVIFKGRHLNKHITLQIYQNIPTLLKINLLHSD